MRPAAIFGLGMAVAVIFTWPLVLYWRAAIPFEIASRLTEPTPGLVAGDHLQLYYYLALLRDMVAGRIPWFSDPYQFSAPHPIDRLNLSFLPFSIVFLLASPLGGAAAYNVTLWLSYPATALAMFGLARRIGLSSGGALVGAVVAAFLPCRVANLAGGYPTGFLLFLLPTIFYFLERAWQERSTASAAGAGALVAIVAVDEPHLLYFLAFLLPLWVGSVLWRWLPNPAAPTRGDRRRAYLLLLGAAFGPAVYYAVSSARNGETSWAISSFVLLLAASWVLVWCLWRTSAQAAAALDRPAWVEEAKSYLPLALLALYAIQLALDVPKLGRSLFLAAALGLAWQKRGLVAAIRRGVTAASFRPLVEWASVFWPLAVGLAVAAAAALDLKVSLLSTSAIAAGRSFHEVELFSPRAGDFLMRASPLYPGAVALVLAVAGLRSSTGRFFALVGILCAVLALGAHAPQWLPLYRLAFGVVPYFGMIRQPGKFFAIAGLALSLIAGFGVQTFAARSGARLRGVVVALAVAAVLLDFSSVLPFGLSSMPTQSRAYAIVAERGRGSNLLELPLWPGDSHYSSMYLYWTLSTKVPTVNGYNATVPIDYVRNVAQPLETMNLGELSERQHQLLRALGVKLVTLHGDAFPPRVSPYRYRYTLSVMKQNPNLEFLAADHGVFLFALREGSYRPWSSRSSSRLGVFYEAENLAGSQPRVADRAASGGWFVHGRPSEPPSPAVFGPHQTFPNGRYSVAFRLRGSGYVDVAAELGTAVLARHEVSSDHFDIVVVGFELEQPRNVEFRVWPAKGGTIDVDWVLLEKNDGSDGGPTVRFEAEDLQVLHLWEQDDPDASGGGSAVIDESASTVVRDGPYRLFPAGRLRVSARGRGAPFVVRVESADGRVVYTTLAVPESTVWTTATSEFTLPEPAVLCTRIVSTGRRAYADYVELGPLP